MEMTLPARADDFSDEVRAFLEIVYEISLQVASQQDGSEANIAMTGNEEEEE